MLSYHYVRPRLLPEALAALQREGAEARVLAGGTTLVRQLKQQRVPVSLLVDIKHIPDLHSIRIDSRSGSRIGTTLTLEELAAHAGVQKYYPLLAEACAAVPAWQVRNRATLGGEICVGSRRSAILAALLCYEAAVTLHGAAGEQVRPLSDFIRDVYSDKSLLHGVLLSHILLGPRLRRFGAVFRGLYQYPGQRHPVVGAAVAASYYEGNFQHARVIISGVNPHLQRYTDVEQILMEGTLDEDRLQRAAVELGQALHPVDTTQASAEYQRAMALHLFRQAVQGLRTQLGNSK